MKVEVVERRGDTLRFILYGVSTSFANALRRIMIAEVPSMTIDDIFLLESNTPLTDEFMAHRLGLVPLTTNLDAYVLPEKCECKSELGCDKCRAVLTLEARAEAEPRAVYSGDLKSEDPKTRPVSDKIPLVELAPGQALKFEAFARLGQGKDNAKWQPVSESSYQNLPVIEIDKKTCTSCGECVNACPRKVLALSNGQLVVEKPLYCFLCGLCEKACPIGPSAIRVSHIGDAFLFTVESTGALPPERIVSEASKILGEKNREFLEQVRNLTGESLKEGENEKKNDEP